jgi:hypothetical protein
MKTSDLPPILEYPDATFWYVIRRPNIDTRNEIEKIPRIWIDVYQEVDWIVSEGLRRLTDENL